MGLQTFSSRHGQWVVVCTDFPDALEAQLSALGFSYSNAAGAYIMRSTGERVLERSFLMRAEEFEHLKFLRPMLFASQESYLLIRDDADSLGRCSAVLKFFDRKRPDEEIGRLVEVTWDERGDEFTYVNGRTYKAVPQHLLYACKYDSDCAAQEVLIGTLKAEIDYLEAELLYMKEADDV